MSMFGLVYVDEPENGVTCMYLERIIGGTYWLLSWREWYEQRDFLWQRLREGRLVGVPPPEAAPAQVDEGLRFGPMWGKPGPIHRAYESGFRDGVTSTAKKGKW